MQNVFLIDFDGTIADSGRLSCECLCRYSGIACCNTFFGKHRNMALIIAKHGCDRRNVLVVGDETRDIEAAKQLGVQSVAVSWGYNHENTLQQYKPDWLIDSPTQLMCFISDEY